jgi:subtilisin-like proprotein convertase family protein
MHSILKFHKKIFFLGAIIITSFISKATHISGGDMDVQWITGNDYRVTLKLFRDCANAGAPFESSLTITVRENGTNSISSFFNMDLKEYKNLKLGDACFTPPNSICMQEGFYTTIITLPNNSNGYYFVWERCCRSPINLNIINDQPMVFYAKIPSPSLRNSSPKFGTYPTNGYMCINETNYFNFDVSDADSDELRFSLISPLAGSATSINLPYITNQNNPGGTYPFAPINWRSPYNINNIVGGVPNMSIDPTTGIITCKPVTQGAFTFAILVEEYRNGVKIGEIIRDIQFFALNCQKKVASINQTPTDDDTALEGCIKASFKFELSKSLAKDTTICYEIQGSAINGVDYAFLDDCITISAGQTYGTIIIDAFNDGISEGKEDIFLIYNPIPCVDFVKDTVFLFIDDAQPIDFELDGVNLTCSGDFSGQIDANITGGYPPYVITITPQGGNSTNYTDANLPITGLPAGTYSVEIDDIYGCGGAAQPVAAVWDAGATFLPDGNGNVYTTTLNVSGISNPIMTDPDEIQQVCLNIEHSFLGDLEMKLIAPDGTELILKERFNAADGNSCDLGEPIAKAPKDGGSSNTDPGIGYDYCFTPTPSYGTMVDESVNYTRNYTDPIGNTYTDKYLPSGAYTSYEPFSDLIGVPLNGDWTIWVKDHLPQDNGWIFNWSIVFKSGGKPGDIITLTEPDPIDITLNGSITQPACGGSTGAINIDINGDFSPFIYSWSNGATTQDISGLSAGTYTVTVTDNNSCTNEASFDVSNATGPGISAVVQDEQCLDSNDGAIDATFTTSGTITSIIWSNGTTTEDISNLSPGDYTVEVTDNSNCKSLQTFTINAAKDIFISGSITNEKCGDQEGEINITVNGGAGSYTYAWSNGEISEDVTDLNQNTYTVTVTDANGCSKQKSFNVINEVGQCYVNCDVAIISNIIVDEICGDGSGSISISVSTSNPPYYVNWSNGMTGDVISGLSAGSYTATVTDAENCEFTQTFTVGNDAGTLAITNPNVTDETCGSGNGAIDVTISGGNGSYTYSWSNSASSQDISNLSAGDYTITVTDGLGCSISATFTVLNDAGSMAINLVSLTDEVCGNGNGSINISVSPSATYSYLWSNGATSEDATNLSAGTYSVVVTDDATSCQLTSQDYVIANSPGSLSVVITDTDNEVCGSSNGEIDLTISGGTPTYDILWNTGATTEDLVDIPAGTYSATITDQNGCTAQTGDIVILNLSGDLSATTIVTNEVCGDGQGAINLIVSGGTPSYDYTWNTGATTEDISNLSSGVYSFTIEDQNGCIFSNSVSVGNDAGTLSIDNINVTNTLCGTSNGAIDISVSGGDGSYTYVWNNGASSQDLTNITNGIYTVTVTDGSGCSLENDITITGTLTLDNVVITDDICGTAVGEIDITISGGSNYTYQWSSGANTQDISELIEGAYTVVVTSFDGCTYTNTFDVGSNPICNELCLNTYSNAASGTIYDSGGASGNYKDDENCGFLIELYCATNINLNFEEFRTESNYDFLLVFDGIDDSGELLLNASGTSIPSSVTAYSGAVYIKYLSDITTNDRGFKINWTSEQATSEPNALFTTTTTEYYINETVSFVNNSEQSSVFSWDINNDGIEDYNSENIDLIFTEEGVYTITLTVTNCFGSDTFSKEIIILEKSEEEEPEDEPQIFAVFPNPSNGLVYVNLASKEFEVIIYNSIGERVNYGINKINDYQYVLDITEHSGAVYFIRINGEPFKIVKIN